MMRALVLLCLLLSDVARAASVSPTPAERVALAPPAASVGFRAYGLGLLPLDGNFTRFDGVLTYDPSDHGHCRVELRIDVASLAMSSPVIRNDVLGPDFMDAAQFPTLQFGGICQPAGLVGTLAMHGVSRPFALDLDWERVAVTAQGRLRRAEWGMTAKPFIGGATVRITVRTSLSPLHSAAGAQH
ncbi:MAG: YceI family protein [Acetobacteraceae bacterium]|nr:YceI family protein [Acetobacteraceae bacterium]